MLPSIERLQSGDFSAFSGAAMRLGLPFKQEMLNEALRAAGEGKDGALKEIHLEVHDSNQVEVRLLVKLLGLSKSFSFELQIEPDLGFPDAPKIKLALPSAHALLGSILEILTSSLGLLPGGIAIVGRVIEVDLAKMVEGKDATLEEQARARAFLKLIKQGEIRTVQGVLFLNLNLQID